MTAPIEPLPPSPQNARKIHGAMVIGLILFVITCHFFLVPKANPAGGMARQIPTFLALSLASCVAGILVSYRMPRISNDETLEAFWLRAGPKAMIPWALLEGAGLLAIVVYSQTASRAAIAIGGVVIVIFALLNPRYFERR